MAIQDYGLTNLTHQSLHAPSVRFQEYGIVAYGYVPNYDGAGNDVLDIAFLDYRRSAVKRLQTDIVMPTDAVSKRYLNQPRALVHILLVNDSNDSGCL